MAGAAFVAGAGLGGACGFAVGGRGVPEDSGATPRGGNPVTPSGDALLDELRRVCSEGSIDELVADRFKLSHFMIAAYPDDEVLWHGVERLAQETLTSTTFPDRRAYALWLARFIEESEHSPQHLAPIAKQLRRVR